MIKFKALSLLNFKGVRNLEIKFGDVTNILAKNGAGKTTIADAIFWTLFGKDSQGREKFNVKTLDENNTAIPRLPHSVTLVIDNDGEEITLKRELVEEWTKPSGKKESYLKGNTTSYYYNDVPLKEKEYKERIDAICKEERFKMITNPFHFVGLKKEQQREILSKMAGEITDASIFAEIEGATLQNLMASKPLSDIEAETKAKLTRLNKDVQDIPSRIDEAKRSIVEFDHIEVTKKITDLKLQVATLQNSKADALKAIEESNKAYNQASADILTLKRKQQDVVNKLTEANDKAYNDKRTAYNAKKAEKEALISELSIAEGYLKSNKAMFENLKTKGKQMFEELQRIKLETFSEGSEYCPTCKQHLPADKIEGLKTTFNTEKVARIDVAKEAELSNRNLFSKTKTQIELKEKDIEALKAKIADFEELQEPVKPEVIWMSIKEYKELTEQINAISERQKQMACETVDNTGIDAQIATLNAQIDTLNISLGTKQANDKALSRVAELEATYIKTQDEIETLKDLEYQIAEYHRIRAEKIEASVAGLFRIVKFRMFEMQVNGAQKPTCEAMVNGVPYSDVNTGGRINAGVDIINAMQKFIGITAPIIIDNAESVLNIEETKAQLIRLVVSDCELTVK